MFLLHGLLFYVLDLYTRYPLIDIPMHIIGGVAIAYFLSSCFSALPEESVSRRLRPLAQFTFVFCLTATVSVFWEFGEYFAETVFRINTLGDVYDTLLDMASGIAGAAFYLLIVWRRGRLGVIHPLKIKNKDLE